MRELPIGLFDSGVGGLTVAKVLIDALPHESIIYLGDNARNPYGERSLEQVQEYTDQLVNFLTHKGIKILVIACNTATVAALPELQTALDIPVIGVIEPGARLASQVTQSNRVIITGTHATVQSQVYPHLLMTMNHRIKSKSVAIPEFVQLAEQNRLDDPLIQTIVEDRLLPYIQQGADTLILGCTHFPLLRPQIQACLPAGVTLVDPGQASIQELAAVLDELDLAAPERAASYQFYTTGKPTLFRQFTDEWLGLVEAQVGHCYIQGGTIIENIDS